MRRLWKFITWTISGLVVLGTIYLSNIPVAAKTYDQSYLPMSGTRVLSPREYLYFSAGADAQVLDRVIKCESGYNINAKNKTSTATGLAQFINSTWISTRREMHREAGLELRLDPYEHIDTLIFLWDGGRGSGHWSESRPCWQRYYDKLTSVQSMG